MKSLALLLIPTLLCGCGWEQGDGHYSVWIDPSFSKEKQAEITTALDVWQSDTNQTVTFSVTKDSTEADDRIRIYPTNYHRLTRQYPGENPGPGDWTTGYCTYSGTGSDIQLSVNLNTPQFIETAEHELGHALGLVHTTVGVMNPGGYYPHVECVDIQQFCTVWDCNPDYMKGCN